MPLFITLLALVVVIANAYAGWLGFPVWQSIAAFALVHTIFRLGKRLIKNGAETDEHEQLETQAGLDDNTLPQEKTDGEDDLDVPIYVSMTGIYIVMLLVAAFWYGIGYGLSRLFG